MTRLSQELPRYSEAASVRTGPGRAGIEDPSVGMSCGFWSCADVTYATAKVRTRQGLVVRHVPVASDPDHINSDAALELARSRAAAEAERRRAS